LLRSRSNVGSHKCSWLQLPNRMDIVSSTRQLHWIISPSSPLGLPASPERRVLGVRRPNSRKIAEPYPRQTCDKGRPISASRNVCRILTPILLKLGLSRFLLRVLPDVRRVHSEPQGSLHKARREEKKGTNQ
jgi:hypothetical protein